MRKTKIICTIGPSSETAEMLEKLMLNGMNVARLNFSHGTHEEALKKINLVRSVASKHDLPIAILLDTKGPEIRLKDFENGYVELEKGQLFKFICNSEYDVIGTKEYAGITYNNLYKDVKVGQHVLIDDGLIDLTIKDIDGTDIVCVVNNGGKISNHKGVNVPDTSLSMPYVSEVDRKDILFGKEQCVDLIALSFVRSAQDVIDVRELLGNTKIKLISKIENQQGVDNIDEIIAVSDGIMVARGDMGVEIPFEKVPIVQKDIIAKTINRGKVVITATNMLESMIKNPRPTRAEVNDVANAVYDGSSCVMLSGESANGSYPIEAVRTMASICEETEKHIKTKFAFEKEHDTTSAITAAACNLAEELNAKAIIGVTISGRTVNKISKFEPKCQIIGCCTSEIIRRQLNIQYGVTPITIPFTTDAEELINLAVKKAISEKLINEGDTVVIITGIPVDGPGTTNAIRVITVK